ncbi:MAG: hypothetical protein IT207_05470 [Fimbriimonadaceae bacterium]|nr:hypothetical protein [Fimbriimonadaceae bacterium]
MRVSASVKAAAAMLSLVCLGILGFRAYSTLALRNFQPTPVEPGEFSILAFARSGGYRIIVSNGIAHLTELRPDAEGGFENPTDDQREIEDAPRLPMREMLASLRGDTEALGTLTMSVNKLSSDDIPVNPVVWRAEDVQKALQGDRAMRARLEKDLQTTLEGQPLPVISKTALDKGILIDSPVEVTYKVEGETKHLTCRVREAYQTRFVAAVQNGLREKFARPDHLIAGVYRQEARAILDGKQSPEDVARALRARFEPDRLASLAVKPSRILSACKVLINQRHLQSIGSQCKVNALGADDCTVTLGLSDEGKMRLWKYSHDNPGFQLLVTVRGVAVAAPRIGTELSSNEVKLTQLPSRSLVQETVDLVNSVLRSRNPS